MGLENILQLKLVPHPEHPEKNTHFLVSPLYRKHIWQHVKTRYKNRLDFLFYDGSPTQGLKYMYIQIVRMKRKLSVQLRDIQLRAID